MLSLTPAQDKSLENEVRLSYKHLVWVGTAHAENILRRQSASQLQCNHTSSTSYMSVIEQLIAF